MKEAIAFKVIEYLLKAGPAVYTALTSRRKQKQATRLITSSVAELLSLNPDVLSVRVDLSNANALLKTPNADLLRAEEMLEKVKSYHRKSTKKKSAKKSVKKKKAPTKTRKKKVGKKRKAAPKKTKKKKVIKQNRSR